jgi:hypothetical protein
VSPRPLVAKTAARIQLRKLWSLRAEPNQRTPVTEFLVTAPENISIDLLNLTIQRPAHIPGGEEIAGLMDRSTRTLSVSTSFSIESQRFTLAHEIGHWILHTGQNYFRDRSLSAPDRSGVKPYYEIEADMFAAELLMPPKYLQRVFSHIFGHLMEGQLSSEEVIESVAIGRYRPRSAQEFASLPRIERARAIASLKTVSGRHFTSLSELLRVSTSAMAIQLLDTGLVR